MIRIKTTVAKLKKGDRISMHGDPPETVTRELDQITKFGDLTFETKEKGTWHCADGTSSVELLFSSHRDAAARIIEALEEFPAEILKAVARAICSECGELNCARHR